MPHTKLKRLGTRFMVIWLCGSLSIIWFVLGISYKPKKQWTQSTEIRVVHLEQNVSKLHQLLENIHQNISVRKHGIINEGLLLKNKAVSTEVNTYDEDEELKISTDSTVILDIQKLPFLPNYRNPCWLEPMPLSYPYESNRYGGKVEGYLSHLTPRWRKLYEQQLASGYTQRLRCLPYFYIGGMPKCGTTDIYDRLVQHPQIAGGLFKEPHYWTRWRFWTDKCFWKEFMCADGRVCISESRVCDGQRACRDGSDEIDCGGPWQCSHMNGGCSHTCRMESHGPVCSCPRNYQLKRDRKTCMGGVTLTEYIDLFDPAAEVIRRNVINYFHPVVTGEATPATFWDNHRWHNEPSNDNSTTEPHVITADLITHVTPDVKMIAMVRDPTARLYSDLLYFYPYATPDKFHAKVLEGISWLSQCFARKSVRACVHEPLDPDRPPEGRYWKPVERMRIGMYSEYVKDWLRVIPRSNLMVIRLEDYSAHRKEVLEDVVKFLGLDDMPAYLLHKWQSETVHNTGSKKYERQGYMRNDTKRLLDRFYKPFNTNLALLLNNKSFLYS